MQACLMQCSSTKVVCLFFIIIEQHAPQKKLNSKPSKHTSSEHTSSEASLSSKMSRVNTSNSILRRKHRIGELTKKSPVTQRKKILKRNYFHYFKKMGLIFFFFFFFFFFLLGEDFPIALVLLQLETTIYGL